jgi:1-pyrroline-5-carboxylate dehydrogenase
MGPQTQVEFGTGAGTAPVNEPVKTYALGSAERAGIARALDAAAGETADPALLLGQGAVHKRRQLPLVMPHRHDHVLTCDLKTGPNRVGIFHFCSQG